MTRIILVILIVSASAASCILPPESARNRDVNCARACARVCARALCVIEQCIAVLAVRHQDSKFKAVSNECIRKNPQMIELLDGWHLSDNLGLS